MGLFSKLLLTSDTTDTEGELTSFSVERNSSATYVDTDGVLQTATGDASGGVTVVEDETGYTYAQGYGSYVDDASWFSGEALGDEVHTSANAASDPNGNEADATTGWSTKGSTLTSDADSSAGTYALKVVSLDGSSDRIELELTVTDATLYKVTFDAKRGAQGTDQMYTAWAGVVDTPSAASIANTSRSGRLNRTWLLQS